MNKSEGSIFEPAVMILLVLSRGAESRRKILIALLSGPKNCSQLAREVELDWWTVQKHLRSLMKENIIKNSPFGNSKFYRLTYMGEEVISAILSGKGQEQGSNSQNGQPKSAQI